MLRGPAVREITSESMSGLTGSVVITDSSPHVMSSVVDFMYLADVPFDSLDHCIDVCAAADKHRILGLVSHCERYLVRWFGMHWYNVKKIVFTTIFHVSVRFEMQVVEQARLAHLWEQRATQKDAPYAWKDGP